MVDRLLPPLLALMLAMPLATRGPCCCLSEATAQTVAGCCQNEAACCESSQADSPCCQVKKPTCCSDKNESECGAVMLGSCGCAGCPSNRVISPIQAASSSPRTPTTDEVPQANTAVSAITPTATATPRGQEQEAALVDRPPPDRQALLCVWTI